MDAYQKGYLKSYYYFLEYFKDIYSFEARHVVIGAGFTYSWMNTILSWRINQEEALVNAAAVMTKAKKITKIEDVKKFDLLDLKNVVSGSYVGVSKLLHFVNPEVFPIYDSNICRYVYGDIENHHVNTKKRFLGYVDEINNFVSDEMFKKEVYIPIINVLKEKGFKPVSKVRAIEMAMFHHQRSR